MAPNLRGGNASGNASGDGRRLIDVVLQALRELRDGRGSTINQIWAWLQSNTYSAIGVNKRQLLVTLKRGVENGTLTVRSGRYKLATRDDRRELRSVRRNRRRSGRRRRRSPRQARRRSPRQARRSCRRRHRSFSRRRRLSCRIVTEWLNKYF
ncbi:protamine-like protein [Schistocerca cancellata]|uniref:protamine-like protein n=1 Tax=Schistocerca cancellata TaxID=274614 RepID=UPI002117FE7B|nr:protamine-like protein [Schistocerca cancellata]